MYLLTANLLLFPHPSIAFATPAKPPTDWSFYIMTSDTNVAHTLGCNQGHFDAGFSPPHTSLVVLDFGVQNSAGTGVVTTQGQPLTNSQVESIAYYFSEGYWECTSTSLLTLGVGTNDADPSYSDATYTALGKDWAQVVQTVIGDDSSLNGEVRVWGANDLEAWNYPTGQVTQ